MERRIAEKLRTLAFELETLGIRVEAEREAPMETVLALYGLTSQIREIAKDVEHYGKPEA